MSTKLTDFYQIATTTVGSGGAANITFSSIPQDYTHLQIRGILRGTNASDYVDTRIRFNSDTAGNYGLHQVFGNGSTPSSDSETLANSGYFIYATAANSSASIFGVGVMDILDYTNTNKFKTNKSLNGNDRNGSGFALFRSTLWLSTSAISSIVIYPAAGNFAQYSSLQLYGVKA
jgi:hypothetical protein